MDAPSYGLVGRGRAALHIARYLELEGRQVTRWHRGLPNPPAEVLGGAGVILLAISDGALAPFIAANPELGDRTLVHFSGSQTVEGADGLHPLMTFGPEPYDLRTYRSIPFVEETGNRRFREIFPGLVNPVWALDPELKPLYHALCVLAGNFTTLLWLKAMDDFENRLGLPRELLGPFLERTAANTLAHGRAAVTGSLARAETGTIDRDLHGLAGDPYRQVYTAIAHAAGAEEVGR
jgi:predicted short-subunit dehydrogenase-like oxidoreductase (DUF2520 family)